MQERQESAGMQRLGVQGLGVQDLGVNLVACDDPEGLSGAPLHTMDWLARAVP